LNYQYTLNFKNEENEGKTALFWWWDQGEVGKHKERRNEGVHGRYILYPHLKIEE
jgi:hypothetical protein